MVLVDITRSFIVVAITSLRTTSKPLSKLIYEVSYRDYKVNILSNIIVLVPSISFLTYDIILCDVLCDCGHMPLHHSRKEILNQEKIDKEKKNISV